MKLRAFAHSLGWWICKLRLGHFGKIPGPPGCLKDNHVDVTPLQRAACASTERPERKRTFQGALIIRKALWQETKYWGAHVTTIASLLEEQLASGLFANSSHLACNGRIVMYPLTPGWKCRPPVYNKLWTYCLWELAHRYLKASCVCSFYSIRYMRIFPAYLLRGLLWNIVVIKANR